jgi:2-keto-4-pentenoate hydratase
VAFDLDSVLADFWQARERGEFFPEAWCDRLDLEQAYRVQLGLIARRCAAGERQVGWKVGLTSPAIQRQFGFAEPVFGCLLEAGHKQSGHVFQPGELIAPGFEVELCLRLRAPLAGRADPTAVRAAVDLCYPALEIIETRGDFRVQLHLALADNAQQKAFVLGDPLPLTPALDLSRVDARVWINGEQVASGQGEGVLGDPLNSVAWLAGKLGAFGRGLQAGDYVMTGSFTRQFPLHPGDVARAEFSSIGPVETRVAAVRPSRPR